MLPEGFPEVFLEGFLKAFPDGVDGSRKGLGDRTHLGRPRGPQVVVDFDGFLSASYGLPCGFDRFQDACLCWGGLVSRNLIVSQRSMGILGF